MGSQTCSYRVADMRHHGRNLAIVQTCTQRPGYMYSEHRRRAASMPYVQPAWKMCNQRRGDVHGRRAATAWHTCSQQGRPAARLADLQQQHGIREAALADLQTSWQTCDRHGRATIWASVQLGVADVQTARRRFQCGRRATCGADVQPGWQTGIKPDKRIHKANMADVRQAPLQTCSQGGKWAASGPYLHCSQLDGREVRVPDMQHA
jgi:hypothetical protein